MTKKQQKSRVGGTARTGAKSTQPKVVSNTNDPNQQQAESYNRDMRRRMERMGSGPSAQDERMKEMYEKQQRKKTKKKQRLEEKRADLRKTIPGGKIRLGKNNVYFLVAATAIVIVLIAVFFVLRQMGLLG